MDDAHFQPLPSAMAMEAAGNKHPLIRKIAREKRAQLRRDALVEQTFSILWERHGTGDDDHRDLAWAWFNLWPLISAGTARIGGHTPSPEEAADFVGDHHATNQPADEDE